MAGKRVFAITAVVVLTSCGGSTAPLSIEGTYHLATVNGAKLPVVVAQSGSNTVTVTDDRLTVTANGTWSELAGYRLLENGQTRPQTTSDGGTWVRTGSSLALYSGTATSTNYIAEVSANRLTFPTPGFVQVFVK